MIGERLIAGLPGLKIRDATGLVQGLRMVKSEAEIEKLAHICAIGSATFARVPDIISEGMPLDEVFRQFRREALAQGADDAPYVVGGAAPGGYADVISPPFATCAATGRRSDDRHRVHVGWLFSATSTGTGAIGAADDTARRAYDVLWRATEAGIAAARPGTTCRDLFRAMSAVIAEMDDSGGDIGRLGHGLWHATGQNNPATRRLT